LHTNKNLIVPKHGLNEMIIDKRSYKSVRIRVNNRKWDLEKESTFSVVKIKPHSKYQKILIWLSTSILGLVFYFSLFLCCFVDLSFTCAYWHCTLAYLLIINNICH
jgi:hypothetical protein